MKKIAAFILISLGLLAGGCTKTDIPPESYDPNVWMQTRQRGEVAYTDYFSGNYIVQTSQGFAVVETGAVIPRATLICSMPIFILQACKPFITAPEITLPIAAL